MKTDSERKRYISLYIFYDIFIMILNLVNLTVSYIVVSVIDFYR